MRCGSHEIAAQLRRRGHDVIAATELEHAGRYSGAPDQLVFERAQDDRRTIVTDNVADYELARLAHETADEPHHGVVYALAPAFNRHRGDQVIGPMVLALDRFLNDRLSEEPLNTAHYLRPAP
jgi:Domain of unknown function (DUF5615)